MTITKADVGFFNDQFQRVIDAVETSTAKSIEGLRAELVPRIDKLDERVGKLDARVERLERVVSDISAGTRKTDTVARNHEDRMYELEHTNKNRH